MKQIYSRLLLLMVFFGASYVSYGQVYYGTLSGPNEFPSNTSPGTGKTVVTIDGNNMRVKATFSGLVTQTTAGAPSSTTASHIHASATLPPLSLINTAGVATQTPSFAGFPLGVQAGTYDHTFDMTLASSYNATYITANGGTVASAFTALKAQIAAGRSYLNIHSNAFPGGEIRGYLIPCPTINVAIPDAFALPSGTLANTVYPAYAPASFLTLQSNVTGGTSPYSYTWSNGATTSSEIVGPTATTNYSLSVQDQNGCPGSATKTVNVVDVSGGKNGDKIVICHKGNELTIGSGGVADHLQHGDMLGNCEPATVRVRSANFPETNTDLAIRVLGNPSYNHFDIQIRGKSENNLRLTVYDYMGRIIETKSSIPSNQTLRLGNSYQPGIYMVEIVQGTQKQTLRLVKAN